MQMRSIAPDVPDGINSYRELFKLVFFYRGKIFRLDP